MLLAVPTAVAVAVEPAIFFLADAGRRPRSCWQAASRLPQRWP